MYKITSWNIDVNKQMAKKDRLKILFFPPITKYAI